jgi:hypothetical protein
MRVTNELGEIVLDDGLADFIRAGLKTH